MAGDFSPLTVDVLHAGTRFAPPALLVAVAIGLGTMDMPVPSVAEWEWLNWKFPRPVKAGETIYARWTLTQKRPPVGGAPTAVVVWRVDVHTADGALCAEGEVGASVRRQAQPSRSRPADQAPAAAPSRRRRGRRSPASTPAPPAEPPPPPVESHATPAAALTAEGKTGAARRRRRRRPRSSGPATNQNGPSAATAGPAAEAAAPPAAQASGTAPAPVPAAGTLSRVIKRLRRT